MRRGRTWGLPGPNVSIEMRRRAVLKGGLGMATSAALIEVAKASQNIRKPEPEPEPEEEPEEPTEADAEEDSAEASDAEAEDSQQDEAEENSDEPDPEEEPQPEEEEPEPEVAFVDLNAEDWWTIVDPDFEDVPIREKTESKIVNDQIDGDGKYRKTVTQSFTII